MVSIRDARAEDAAEVAAVHIRAWQVGYRGLFPDAYLDDLRVEERAARYTFGSTDPRAPGTILALVDGAIRGFVTVGRSADDDTRDIGIVHALYVDPSHWRSGIGRQLMLEADVRLRALGFEEAILWILVGNDSAERFYRSLGWLPDGARRLEDVWGIEADVVRYRAALR